MHHLSECNRSELFSILTVEEAVSVEDKKGGKTLKMKREIDSRVLFVSVADQRPFGRGRSWFSI